MAAWKETPEKPPTRIGFDAPAVSVVSALNREIVVL
jgi:hypothetical protein